MTKDQLRHLPIQLNLPECFFESEERDGYLVDSKLKRIWAVELDLFNEFSRVCNKNGIRFQVFAGTLLGAIRHKGFIPWDDDFDVCMDYQNYKKLCTVAQKEFLPPYFFQTSITDRKYFLPFARLRNSLTTAVVSGCESPEYNCGIYIDIHCLHGSPESILLRKFQDRLLSITAWVIEDRIGAVKVVNRKYLSKFIRFIFSPLPYKTLVSLYEYVSRVTGLFCNRLALISHGFDFASRYRIGKRDICNTISVPFEQMYVPVPSRYDVVLKEIYGDYMKFPPLSERGKWHEGQIHFEPDVPYKEYFARLEREKAEKQ